MSDKNNHWNEYWDEGFITSFCSDFSSNYEDSYKQFWASVFEPLADGSKVLDVATGNLALPLLAKDIIKNDVELNACDLADISIEKISQKNQISVEELKLIHLRSGVNVEELPYAAANFDLITSMYGFEYADKSKAIASIADKLSHGGRFVAISHHKDSIILERNIKTADCLKDMLYRKKVFDQLADLSKAIGVVVSRSELKLIKQNKKAEKLRKKLNADAQSLVDEYEELFFETGFGVFIQDFFQKQIMNDLATRSKTLLLKKNELEKHLLRLNDLTDAAFDSQSESHFLNCLDDLGLKVIKHEKFFRKDDMVGVEWVLEKY